jgi:hypothetical protein
MGSTFEADVRAFMEEVRVRFDRVESRLYYIETRLDKVEMRLDSHERTLINVYAARSHRVMPRSFRTQISKYPKLI